MRLNAGSFLLGFTAASAVPIMTRYFRPLTVQIIAATMTAFDDVRHVFFEQMEVLEDLAAEAQVKRDVAPAVGEMPTNASAKRRRRLSRASYKESAAKRRSEPAEAHSA